MHMRSFKAASHDTGDSRGGSIRDPRFHRELRWRIKNQDRESARFRRRDRRCADPDRIFRAPPKNNAAYRIVSDFWKLPSMKFGIRECRVGKIYMAITPNSALNFSFMSTEIRRNAMFATTFEF